MNEKTHVSFNRFIDENHHDLLDHLVHLEQSDHADFNKAFFQLIRDLETHFQHEEMILRGAGFEQIEEHTLEHRELALELRKLASTATDHADVPHQLELIKAYIFEHELSSDQAYWGLFPEEVPREPLLRWTEDLSTGDEDVDLHHQALVRHINRFYVSVGKASDRNHLIRELEILKAYSNYHFSQEEGLFSLDAAHLAEHRDLLSSLDKLIEKVSEGRYDGSVLRDFFDYWLLQHIRSHDVPAITQWLSGR